MPGMTGFDLLERLDDVPQVIFTTAYDEYAIKAFEVNALDYLLKPIVPARLAAALARRCARAPDGPRLEQVFVRDGERCWIVRLTDIFLLESEGNYTRLYFGAEKPLIRRSLNALEEQLDPAIFFRAGRKEIINLKWIERVDLAVTGGLLVTTARRAEVEMSRRQSARLKEVLSLVKEPVRTVIQSRQPGRCYARETGPFRRDTPSGGCYVPPGTAFPIRRRDSGIHHKSTGSAPNGEVYGRDRAIPSGSRFHQGPDRHHRRGGPAVSLSRQVPAGGRRAGDTGGFRRRKGADQR